MGRDLTSQVDRGATEVSLSAVKTPERTALDVRAALHAICSTGKGRCWYCDLRLPRVEEAENTGWDVQRVEGERVASIILVCPACQVAQAELGEEEFLRNLSLRVCNATC
jgi:hypothetical protein